MKKNKHRRISDRGNQRNQTQASQAVNSDHEDTGTDGRAKRIRNENDNTLSDIHSDRQNNNSDDAGKSVDSKARGPTNMPRVWARREQVRVDFDDLGKPVGPHKSEYVEFIGTLVRNGDLLPLDYEDWHKVPNSIKKNLFDLIKEKFTGMHDMEDVAWDILSKSWRTWKNRVKSKYFDPNSSVEENLRKRPNTDDLRVLPDQWKNLVIFWSTDKSRKISAQNKENRAQKTIMHVTGKKSFSQIRYHLKKETRELRDGQVNNGQANEMDDEPSRMDLFERCYTKKGETGNPVIANSWQKMQEKRSELSPNSKDIGPSDIFSQVAGDDKGGRVRMYGYGVLASDVYGESLIRGRPSRTSMSYKKDIGELKQIVMEQNKQMMEQNKQIQELLRVSKQIGNNESPPEVTRVPSSSSSHYIGTSFRQASLRDKIPYRLEKEYPCIACLIH